MSDAINKALLCGLGLASLTKETIEKTVQELIKQSKLSEAEGKRVLKKLPRRSKQAQKALVKAVDTEVHKVLRHLDLAAIVNGRLKDAKPTANRAKKARRAGSKTKARAR